MNTPVARDSGLSATWRGDVKNDTHLDLTVSWLLRDDGTVILLISERNNERTAAGLIIPKHRETLLS